MDIEILEEYEDLVMPTMQADTDHGGGDSSRQSRHEPADDNISESSESVDMDIFDESSDEETNAATERVVENVMQKRHQGQDDSEDSLDQLVRELARNRENTMASTSITSCLRKTNNCDKTNSSPVIHKHVAFAPLPTVQATQSNVAARQPIESFRSTTSTAFERKPTIVKPEKIQFKDPAFDPLSLEQSDILNALSDVSNDTFVSTTEIDDTQNVTSESSYGSVNSTTKGSTISSFISTADLPEKPQVISHSILVPADAALMDVIKNSSLELESKQITSPAFTSTSRHQSPKQIATEQCNEAKSISKASKNAAEETVIAQSGSSKNIAENIKQAKEIAKEPQNATQDTQKSENELHSNLKQTAEIKESEKLLKAAKGSNLKSTKPKEESAGNSKVPTIQSKTEFDNTSKAKLEQKKLTAKIGKPENVTEEKATEKIEANKSGPSGSSIKTEKDKISTTSQTKQVDDCKKPTQSKGILEASSKAESKVIKETVIKSNVEDKSKTDQSKEKTNEQANKTKTTPTSKPRSSITQPTNVKPTNIAAEKVVSTKPNTSAKPNQEKQKQQKNIELKTAMSTTTMKDQKSSSGSSCSNSKTTEKTGSTIVKNSAIKQQPNSSEKCSPSVKTTSTTTSSSKDKQADLNKSAQKSRDLTPQRSNVTDNNKSQGRTATSSTSQKQEQASKKNDAPKTPNSDKLEKSASSSSSSGTKQAPENASKLKQTGNALSFKKLEKSASSISLKREAADNKKDAANVSIPHKLERSATSINLKKPQDVAAKKADIDMAKNVKVSEKTASTGSLKNETKKETQKRKSTPEGANSEKHEKTASSSSLKSETTMEAPNKKRISEVSSGCAKKLERTPSSSSSKSESDKDTPKRKIAAEAGNDKKLEKSTSSSSLKSESVMEASNKKSFDEVSSGGSKKLQRTPSSSSLKSESDKDTPKRKIAAEAANDKKLEKSGSSSSLKSESDKEKHDKKLEKSASSSSFKSESVMEAPNKKSFSEVSSVSAKKLQRTPSSSSLKSESDKDTPKRKIAVEAANDKKLEKSGSSSSLKSESVMEAPNKKSFGEVSSGSAKKLERTPSSSSLKSDSDKEKPKRKTTAEAANAKKLEKSASSINLKSGSDKEKNDRKLEKPSSSSSLKSDSDKGTQKRKSTAEAAVEKTLGKSTSSSSLKSVSDKETPKGKSTVEVSNSIKKPELKSSTSSLKSEDNKSADNVANTKNNEKTNSATNLKSEPNKDAPKRKHTSETGKETPKRKHTGEIEHTTSENSTKTDVKKDAASVASDKKEQKTASTSHLKTEESKGAEENKQNKSNSENVKKLQKTASSSSLKSELDVSMQNKLERSSTTAGSAAKQTHENTPKRKDTASLEKSVATSSSKEETQKEAASAKEVTVKSSKPVADKKGSPNKQESSKQDLNTTKASKADVTVSAAKSSEVNEDKEETKELSEINETEKATDKTDNQTDKEIKKSDTDTVAITSDKKKAATLSKSMGDNEKDDVNKQQESKALRTPKTTIKTTIKDEIKTDNTKINVKAVDEKAKLSTEETKSKEKSAPAGALLANKSKEPTQRITKTQKATDKNLESNKLQTQSSLQTTEIKGDNAEAENSEATANTGANMGSKLSSNVVKQNENPIEQIENFTQTPTTGKKELRTKAARKAIYSTNPTDEQQPVSSSTQNNFEKETNESKSSPQIKNLSNTPVKSTNVGNKPTSSGETNSTPKTKMLKRLQTDSKQQNTNIAIDEKRQLRKRGVEESPDLGKVTKSSASKNVSELQLKRNASSPAEEVSTPTKKLKVEITRKSRRFCDEASTEEHLVGSNITQPSKSDSKILTPKTKAKTNAEANKLNAKSTTEKSAKEPKAVESLPDEKAQNAKQASSTTTEKAINKTASKKVNKTGIEVALSKEVTADTKEKEEVVQMETESTGVKDTTTDNKEKRDETKTEVVAPSKETKTNIKEKVDPEAPKAVEEITTDKIETESTVPKETKTVEKEKTQEHNAKKSSTVESAADARPKVVDGSDNAEKESNETEIATIKSKLNEKTKSNLPITAKEACASPDKMPVQVQNVSDSQFTKPTELVQPSAEPTVMTFSEWLARKNSQNASSSHSETEQQQKTIEISQAKSTEAPKNTNLSKPKSSKRTEIEILTESLGKEIRDALSSETASEDETIEAQIRLRSSPRKLESHANEKQISAASNQSKSTRTTHTRQSEIEYLKELSGRNAKISKTENQFKNATSKKDTPVASTLSEPRTTDALEPSSNKKLPALSSIQSKTSKKSTVEEEISLEKPHEIEIQQMVSEAVPNSTSMEGIEDEVTPTELSAVDVVKIKRPRRELEILRNSMPKDMRESGIEELIRAHADSPRCLTKRSIATALAASKRSSRKTLKLTQPNTSISPNVSNQKRLSMSPHLSEGIMKLSPTPPAELLVASDTTTVTAAKKTINVPSKATKVHNKDAPKTDKTIANTPKTMTQPFKCRKVRVRLNRLVVRRYLQSQGEKPGRDSDESPQLQQKSGPRKRKATQPVTNDAKKFAAAITPTSVIVENQAFENSQISPRRNMRTVQAKPNSTSLPQNRRSRSRAQAKTTPTRSKITETIAHASVSPTQLQSHEDLLLTPISVAPVLATTPTVTTESGRRGRKKKTANTTVTSSLGGTARTAALNRLAVQSATPPILPSSVSFTHSSTLHQVSTPTLPISPLVETVFAPKREIDEDEFDIRPTSSAAAAMSTITSTNYTPPAELQSSFSSSIPLVISGATSHSLPPGFIDNAGTRLYSYLHPTRYNSNHGNVMLDYCCPNLDGPMTAIDPTRRHDKIDAVVRELPTFISMETRLVTRAELEANSNSIPAAIRHKVQRMSSNKSSSTPMTNEPATRTNLNTNVVPINLSALQKQLPSTTTLTAKTGPTQRPDAKAASGIHGATSTTNMITTITTPTAIIKPTTLEEMRAKNRVSLKNFDLLLKKHYSRIAMLTYTERQRVLEAVVNSTQLMSRDIDIASRVFQEYVTQMTLITANPPTLPTTAAITVQAATTLANAITPTINQPTTATSPTTRAQAKRATKSVQPLPKMVRKTMPIYNSDRNIIGYQVQMVPQESLTESDAVGLTAKTASLPSLAPTTTNSINNSLNSPVASTSAMASVGRRSGIFVIDNVAGKTSKAAASSSPILSNILNSTTTTTAHRAVLHTSTPNTTTAAGSVVTRSGRGVNVRQKQLPRTGINSRIQATSPLSTSLPIAATTPTLSSSLPGLPTLTRNPHLPPISEPSNQAVVTPHTATGYGQADLSGTSNNSTQLIVVNHDMSGNPLPTADESILPDECSNTSASIIKSETIDY